MDQHGIAIELIGLGSVTGIIPVYLGLGVALMTLKVLNRGRDAFLIGLSVGILLYLFFDAMHEAVELTGARDILSWAIFPASLFVGLVAFEQQGTRLAGGAGAPLFLPYTIAVGMGLHNLGEGLAIGASYAQGQWALSGMLAAGFVLHNGMEGFGIVGPSGSHSPSLKDIILLGLLAGGPTCMGTLISGYGVSPYLSVAFYTLAAGSLLYAIISLVALAYTSAQGLHAAFGIFLGMSLAHLTGQLLTLLIGVPT